MIRMPWLEPHAGSIDDCIDCAERMLWNLLVFKGDDGSWNMKSGESVLFSAADRESVEAFLYGMGLAYSGIPEDLLTELETQLRSRLV